MGGTNTDMSDEMEDFDIYENLPEERCLEEEAEKLQEQVKLLEERSQSLESNVEKLNTNLTEIKQTRDNLARNISELYKTAKAEIDRKDRIISELRAQLDQYVLLGKVAPPTGKRPRENSVSSNENDTQVKRTKRDFDSHRSFHSPTHYKRNKSRSKSRERHKHSSSRSKDDHKKEYKSNPSDKHSHNSQKYEHRESSHKMKTTGDGKITKSNKNPEQKPSKVTTINTETGKGVENKTIGSVAGSKDLDKPKTTANDNDKTKAKNRETEDKPKTHKKEDRQKTSSKRDTKDVKSKEDKKHKEVTMKKDLTLPTEVKVSEKKVVEMEAINETKKEMPKDKRSENLNIDITVGVENIKKDKQTSDENSNSAKVQTKVESSSEPTKKVDLMQDKDVIEPVAASTNKCELVKTTTESKKEETVQIKLLENKKPPVQDKVKRDTKCKTARIQDVTTKLQRRLGVFNTESEQSIFSPKLIAHVKNAVFGELDNSIVTKSKDIDNVDTKDPTGEKINVQEKNEVTTASSKQEKQVDNTTITSCSETKNEESVKVNDENTETTLEPEKQDHSKENIKLLTNKDKEPKLIADPRLKKSKDGSAKKESKEKTISSSKKEKQEEEPLESSDRVLRSAARRNSSREKMEKSTDSFSENLESQTSKDDENPLKSFSLTPLKSNISTVNLTDEGDIPVLHLIDERSPIENYFDGNLSSSAITSSPLRGSVDLQTLKEDLNITLDKSSVDTSKLDENLHHAVSNNNSSVDSSLQNSDLSKRTVLNTSSAKKRRRVVLKVIE